MADRTQPLQGFGIGQLEFSVERHSPIDKHPEPHTSLTPSRPKAREAQISSDFSASSHAPPALLVHLDLRGLVRAPAAFSTVATEWNKTFPRDYVEWC